MAEEILQLYLDNKIDKKNSFKYLLPKLSELQEYASKLTRPKGPRWMEKAVTNSECQPVSSLWADSGVWWPARLCVAQKENRHFRERKRRVGNPQDEQNSTWGDHQHIDLGQKRYSLIDWLIAENWIQWVSLWACLAIKVQRRSLWGTLQPEISITKWFVLQMILNPDKSKRLAVL